MSKNQSEQKSSFSDRRSFLAAAMTTVASSVVARDYGPNAPVRYPEPDVISLDKSFDKYRLGNAPIQRLYHSQEMLWAEGPAWNGWAVTCCGATFPIIYS